MSIKLDFNLEKLSNLLLSFNILTGIKIVLFDGDFNEVSSYPTTNCQLCSKIRNSKKGEYNCYMSNRNSFFKCSKDDHLNIYHCHAGLLEAMINLKIDNTIVGYIMFGQISDEKDLNKRYLNLLKNTKNYDISASDIKALSNSLIYKNEQELRAASTILLALSKYAVSEKIVSIKKEEFIQELDDLIDKNIANTHLNVNYIAKELNLSRTILYNLSSKYIGYGIAEYIREKRIKKAKELLLNTNHSITEISNLIGFSNYNYFCRSFKKIVGISSKEYRKNK